MSAILDGSKVSKWRKRKNFTEILIRKAQIFFRAFKPRLYLSIKNL